MVTICELNGIEPWYSSGQTISGRICLALNERILIKAISFTMEGYAQIEWNSNKQPIGKPKIVKGRDDFIASTNFLVGSDESTSILMSSGNYTYNFSCNIPEKCPSTYNSIHGHIRYQMKIILDYGNKIEEILKQTFHVVKQYDLRPETLLLKVPLDMEVFEYKCFCEYWKTPLCLYVNLNQGGFAPGETVSVYARLLNDGNIPLKSIAISLNQVVTYTSKTPRKLSFAERYNMVQNLNSLAGKETLFEFLELVPVPSVPPSSQNECSVLQISYEIEVFVDQIKGSRTVLVRVPILIGTIPIEAELSAEDCSKPEEHESQISGIQAPKTFASSIISSGGSLESLPNTEMDLNRTTEIISNANAATSFQEAPFMSSTDLNKNEKNVLHKEISGFKPKYLYYEINEDIQMTPTTMEITKEITIAST